MVLDGIIARYISEAFSAITFMEQFRKLDSIHKGG